MARFVFPAPVIEAGLKVQVVSCGSPEQDAEEKLMAPL